MSVREQLEEELRICLVNFLDGWAIIAAARRWAASAREAAAWHTAWHTTFASTVEFPNNN